MNLPDWLNRPYARSRVLRPAKPLQNADMEKRLGKYEGWIIFVLSLLLNLILAYFLNFVWHIGNGDGLSRTANAYYVLYSREPHLAAIGFVWPPLPSLLQLPLIPITKALGWLTFTGGILSSVFGALSLVMMNRLLANLKFPPGIRWVFIAFLQFHPDTWYLFASGMAEPIFLFLVITILVGMNLMPDSLRSWVIVGCCLALAFLVRYESLGIIVAVGVAVIVHMWASERNWRSKSEGWLLAILMPPAYIIALWLFFNWTLLGDPFYFYRSFYSLANASDIAKVVGIGHPMYLAWGNIAIAIKDGMVRSIQQFPAYPVLIVFSFISILIHKSRRGFGLFIVMVSVTAFTVLQVYLGTLANWLRYWFYAAPFSLVLAGLINENMQRKWRVPLYALLIVSFIVATPLSLYAMRDARVGGDEQRLSALILDPQVEPSLRDKDWYWIDLNDAPIVAKVVDQYSQKGLVMVDSSSSFSVIMDAQAPQRLFITNDSGFDQALAHPQGVVSYILLLDPTVQLSAINVAYPTLFDDGASWATLAWDSGPQTIEHWRIYAVKK